MHRVSDLPTTAQELRLENVTAEALDEALGGLVAKADAQRRRAFVAGGLAMVLGVALFKFPASGGLSEWLRQHHAGGLHELVLGGLGVALGLFALWSWDRVPQLEGVDAIAQALRALGARVQGPYSASVSWALERAAGPLEHTRVMLCGALAGGAPFTLGVDVIVSSRKTTSYSPSGVGVRASRSRRSSRSYAVWLQVADDAPTRVALDQRPPTVRDVAALFDAPAKKAGGDR